MPVFVTKRPTIEVKYSADEFELFDVPEIPGRVEAARDICDSIADAYNGGGNRTAIREAARAAQTRHRELGAMDSEPDYLVREIIESLQFEPKGTTPPKLR